MPYSWKVGIDLKLVVCFSTAEVIILFLYIFGITLSNYIPSNINSSNF